jgi:hypothetical protein
MHSSAGGASAAPGGSITQRVLREFAALHHELTEVLFPFKPCQHRDAWAMTLRLPKHGCMGIASAKAMHLLVQGCRNSFLRTELNLCSSTSDAPPQRLGGERACLAAPNRSLLRPAGAAGPESRGSSRARAGAAGRRPRARRRASDTLRRSSREAAKGLAAL